MPGGGGLNLKKISFLKHVNLIKKCKHQTHSKRSNNRGFVKVGPKSNVTKSND